MEHGNTLKPKSLKLLMQGRKPLVNIHSKVRSELSKIDSVAFWITKHVGTMGFFLLVFSWTVIWISWNTLAPVKLRFDPFPSFVLWLFISNMIQIFLMPLLLIGQNLQGKYSEAIAQNDLEVNIKAETEIKAILEHLEYQNSLILEIAKKLEK